MPIRPENKGRYPDNWPEIRAQIAERSGDRCEWCGAPNRTLIRRGTFMDGTAVWQPASSSAFCPSYSAANGIRMDDATQDLCNFPSAPIKVILTVGHLDHTPENCDPENLRHLCQRCHNQYDAKNRAAGRKGRGKNAQG